MATRQEIQIAQDLIRFVNIMNDLLDCASYSLKEIDPQTGDILQVQEEGLFRDITLDELKQSGARTGLNVLGYCKTINDFITKHGEANVSSALVSLGINLVDIQADIAKMETEAKNLGGLTAAKTKEDLIPFADSIDANIPKLTLVRRSWCLGD